MRDIATEATTISPGKTDSMGLKSNGKTIRGAVVGTVVEYYDFGIYGYMAAFIAHLFFVKGDDNAAMLGTFAAFAVAFFLRIPGGIVFGHIGDRYGRKRALTWTIILMAAATALMGMIPTYETLGLWATVTLVLARCLQEADTEGMVRLFGGHSCIKGGKSRCATSRLKPPQYRPEKQIPWA